VADGDGETSCVAANVSIAIATGYYNFYKLVTRKRDTDRKRERERERERNSAV
jgi:hypothetical protein